MSLVSTRPLSNCIHVHAESQWELTRSFVRLQEFYESPYPGARSNYGWTLDNLAEMYKRDGKPFDYFSKWNGMNVPGHVVMDFFGNFDDLGADEVKLNALLWRAFRKGVNPYRFYVIGTHQSDDITHELAHALFYLDQDYRDEMIQLVMGLQQTQDQTVYQPVIEFLKSRGYSHTVFDDEAQAYLATSDEAYLQKKLGQIVGGYIFHRAAPFRAAFKKHAKMEPLS